MWNDQFGFYMFRIKPYYFQSCVCIFVKVLCYFSVCTLKMPLPKFLSEAAF